MHTGPISESQGDLGAVTQSGCKCPRCGSPLIYRIWESRDGAYEDTKYSCTNAACGHVYWVDGIDS